MGADMPTSNWCFFARESDKPMNRKKQNTDQTGALRNLPSRRAERSQVSIAKVASGRRRLRNQEHKLSGNSPATFLTSTVSLDKCPAAGVALTERLFEMLEPCEGKLSRTVLRGKGGRKAP
jgi:hypothetical protein